MLLNPFRFGGGGGGPFTFGPDAFTRSDGALGANYTDVAGGAWDSGGLALISNAATAFSFSRKGNILATSVRAFANNQRSTITLGLALANGEIAYACARMSAAGVGYVAATNGASGTGNTFIGISQAGGITELAAVATTFTAADTLGIEVNGTTITMLKNGSSVGSVTDATIASGQPGLGQWGGTVGTRLPLDNFTAVEL